MIPPKADLEKLAWYRFMRVIAGLVIFLIIAISAYLSITISFDLSKDRFIECADGSRIQQDFQFYLSGGNSRDKCNEIMSKKGLSESKDPVKNGLFERPAYELYGYPALVFIVLISIGMLLVCGGKRIILYIVYGNK